jgi:hypothetical protein
VLIWNVRSWDLGQLLLAGVQATPSILLHNIAYATIISLTPQSYRLRHNHIAYATGYTSVEGRKFTTYSRRYAAMYHQRGGWSGFDCASNTRSSPKMHNIMSFGGSPSSIHAFLMVSIHSQTCHPTTVDTGPSQLQMRITAASLWS